MSAIKATRFLLYFSILLLSIVAVQAFDKLGFSNPIAVHPALLELKAATPKTILKKRSPARCLTFTPELHYIGDDDEARLSARVRLSSKLPTLALEDIEDHLYEVSCTDRFALLDFDDGISSATALRELSSFKDFYLITSHTSCNSEGQRAIYWVSDVQVHEARRRVSLAIEPLTWKNAAESLSIDFGQQLHDIELRRPQRIGKRQVSTSTSSAVSFSYPPTTSFPTATSIVSHTFNSSLREKRILPWDGQEGEVTISGPAPLGQITLKCKACDIRGSISLLSGTVTVNSNTTEIGELVHFYDDGYVEIAVDDLETLFDLETSISPQKRMTVFEANLPPIGIPGFQIPDIGVVGPMLQGKVLMGLEIDTELDFEYGFSAQLPRGLIRFNISKIEDSSVGGLAEASFHALPFQARARHISLTAQTGFQPQLVLGLSILDNHGVIGAGISFDLPSATVTVTELDHVDVHCDPLPANSSTSTSSHDGIFEDGLLNIVPELEVGVQLIRVAHISAGAFSVNDDEPPWDALTTSYVLPTACLAFDSRASTYGMPEQVASASASAVAGGAGQKNGGAVMVRMGGGWWWIFGVALGCWSAW